MQQIITNYIGNDKIIVLFYLKVIARRKCESLYYLT